MRNKFLNQRNAIFGLLAMSVVAAMVFFVRDVLPEKIVETLPDRFGTISGLKAGDSVSYEILSSINDAIAGTEVIDESGEFKIPLFAAQDMEEVLYNLEITQDGAPVNVNFHVQKALNALKVSGRGFEKFSDIKLEGIGKGAHTKSDWSGGFNLEKIDLGQDLENLESFRVALFNNNVLSDARDFNPLIIEVMETAGGGGPTDDGVNEWSKTSGCSEDSSSPELSICDQGDTEHQINEVRNNYVTSLMLMGEQFSAVAMQYVQIIGTFFDAKMQLETQRTIQHLQAEAHKDYHPSDQMCVFGSFVKSVATVEEKARYERQAFNKIMMERYTNANLPTSEYQGSFLDLESRLRQFRTTYCQPTDHNNGLKTICQHSPSNPELEAGELVGGQDPERINRDLDYTRLADSPLTLDVDFSDGVFSADEEDMIALARNLYWPEILDISPAERVNKNARDLMNARRLIAVGNVAHNSFAHIMSMKAQAPEGIADQSGWSFMKAFMRDFGLSDTEIIDTLGERPSYYAQMEVLTKKLYQSPDFYTNLYDKPTNIDRISASMEAIKLMQMRDWFQATTRREMLSSLLVEEGLANHVGRLNDQIISLSAE